MLPETATSAETQRLRDCDLWGGGAGWGSLSEVQATDCIAGIADQFRLPAPMPS